MHFSIAAARISRRACIEWEALVDQRHPLRHADWTIRRFLFFGSIHPRPNNWMNSFVAAPGEQLVYCGDYPGVCVILRSHVADGVITARWRAPLTSTGEATSNDGHDA
jgi:hypothetical protein